MGNLYFPATAMAGKLYVAFSKRWDTERLGWVEESVVDVFVSLMVHRKAKTPEELEEVLRTSERGLPAIRVWIHEGLEAAAKKLWQHSAQQSLNF